MAIEFKLPDLGEGIHEAEILAIKVKEGQVVKEDEIIFEVETDKAVVEIPCPVAGTVEKIHVKVGEVGKVGNVMITFSGGASAPAAKKETAKQEQPVAVPAGAREVAAPAARVPSGGNGKSVPATHKGGSVHSGVGPVPAAPATRRLAREMGIDLRQVPASGPGGRVMTDDVRSYADGGSRPAGGGAHVQGGAAAAGMTVGAPSKPVPSIAEKYGGGGSEAGGGGPLTLSPFELPDFTKFGQTERVPLRSLRKKIAINMAQSWSHVPHVSNFDEADITDIEKYRALHEGKVAAKGGRLTLTVLALKAVVAGLKRFPQFNCSLDEQTSEIVFKHYFNIGVAVATERGLIVPVVKNVDQKNIYELSIELADLARKTREGKIEMERLQGGTFTITNIGPIGGTGMVPMVNYPEVGIMGMARSADKPVVRNGEIVIRNILPMALSFDHRVADGAEAAMFLRHIASCLEDPFQLLLEM